MDFRILADMEGRKKFFLKKEKIYLIPAKATHIHIYSGKLCFGISLNGGSSKTKRGKFFEIPKMLPGGVRVSAVNFSKYHHDKSGNHYGEPEFFGGPVIPKKIVPY